MPVWSLLSACLTVAPMTALNVSPLTVPACCGPSDRPKDPLTVPESDSTSNSASVSPSHASSPGVFPTDHKALRSPIAPLSLWYPPLARVSCLF